jgi:diguanylate cyclase (GGDEF)-like protein/putative nucleotidyltransferase with HDIG domain
MSTKRFAQLTPATQLYVSAVIVAGAVTVFFSLSALVSLDTRWDWLVLAVLTLLSGSATIKLPSLPATISVSETFVFTSLLLFGAPAATLTVALDTLVISFWSYRRGDPLYKIAFNLFALPLTIWIAAHIFFALPNYPPWIYQIGPLFGHADPVPAIQLLVPLFVLAVSYFLLNSWLITFAIALERSLRPGAIWKDNFLKLSLNYIGGASVAALLVSYTRNVDLAYLALVLPLLLALYFTYASAMGRVADANKHLTQLNELYMSTIETLAMAIDAKDQITHGHIRRVQRYAIRLARKVGVEDPALISAIEAAALLHDMGKLAVPEYILNKPGPLTPAEFEKMKLHSAVGADILSSIDFPYPVVPIVRHHHENWDGTGYPHGLRGTQIPIGARILAVVDCFDALTSDRPYRPKLPDSEAIRILMQRRGSMYDPIIVDAFLKIHDDLGLDHSRSTSALPLQAITDASHVAPAVPVERAPLEEIAASADEMLTLFELARGLNGQLSLHDAGDIIAKHVRRLIPCSTCVIFRYSVDTDTLTVGHAGGDATEYFVGLNIGIGQRLSGWVAAHRKTIRNSDPILDLGDSARATNPRLRSCLSAPLVVQGRLVGVISLYSTTQNAFSDEHQRILEAVSGQVSTIVENAANRDQVAESQLMRDSATGLPNIERLRQVSQEEAAAFGDHFSVVVVEITSFSDTGRIMDVHVLRQAVESIRNGLRSSDVLFRNEPHQFVALLLNTTPTVSAVVADRLRQALREHPDFSDSVRTAVSWASTPADGNSVRQLLRAANSRLVPSFPRTTAPSGKTRRGAIH